MTIPDKWETKEWEKVCEEGLITTDRLRAPGGWLYRCIVRKAIPNPGSKNTFYSGQEVTMCFVHNTAHHLYIQNLEKQLEDAQKELNETHELPVACVEVPWEHNDTSFYDDNSLQDRLEAVERERDQALDDLFYVHEKLDDENKALKARIKELEGEK